MQIEYDGSHSITFYDYRNVTNNTSLDSLTYNTWTTWHLIPSSAPRVSPYEAQISMANVGGSTWVVDLSEALTGRVLAGRRTGDWTFIMDTERAKMTPWELFYKIREDINAKWLAVVLDDAPEHTYTGRIFVSDFTVGNQYANIKLSYNLGSNRTSRVGKRGG